MLQGSDGSSGGYEETRTLTQFPRRVSFAQQTFVRYMYLHLKKIKSGKQETTSNEATNETH